MLITKSWGLAALEPSHPVTRGLWTLAACLLSVGGLLTLRDADPRELPPLPSAVASVAQDEPESPQYLSKPIREIQPIVDRVLAGDPDTDGQAPSDLGGYPGVAVAPAEPADGRWRR